MNQLFQYHKELNMKKTIIAVVILLFLIVITIEIISGFLKKDNKEDFTQRHNPNTTFTDKSQSISIEFPKQYGFSQYHSSDNYLIELRNENNLNIFISRKDLIGNKTIADIANADLQVYINEFTSYSNLSELKEFAIGDKTAYTYSFHYPDSVGNVPYYLQVVWLETDTGYYIFDIEFPLESLNSYTNIINEVTNSFKIL